MLKKKIKKRETDNAAREDIFNYFRGSITIRKKSVKILKLKDNIICE